MLEHYITAEGIYVLKKDGEIVLSIQLDQLFGAIHVTTPNEVFEGDPSFIKLTGDM